MKTGKLRGIIVLFALITIMGHFMVSDVNVYASSAMIELAVNESEIFLRPFRSRKEPSNL